MEPGSGTNEATTVPVETSSESGRGRVKEVQFTDSDSQEAPVKLDAVYTWTQAVTSSKAISSSASRDTEASAIA